MVDTKDPVLVPEGAPSQKDVNTVADPPATEAAAESSGKLEESADATPGDLKDQLSEEIEVVVEGEAPPAAKESAPAWVKDLRREHRELKARNAELERLASAASQGAAADLGPKPTLEGCDYDAGVFEGALEKWQEARRSKDSSDAKAVQEADAARRTWQSKLDAYARSKEELSKKIPDYADSEATVQSGLSVMQQGVLLHGAENAALVVAALGQNPKLVQELADTKDPIAFAFKVAKLEVRLRMQKRNQAPSPEKAIKGSGSISGLTDSQLERLRATAEKTGDYSKVVEYNRQKRVQR